MFFKPSRIGLLVAVFALAGCGQKQAPAPARYAVVRFENLSGDPGLEWTARAAGELLARTLSGKMDGPVIAAASVNRMSAALGDRPSVTPGVSAHRIAAQLSGANRLISGYIEKSGSGIRVTAIEDDLLTGKRLRSVSVLDSTPMKAFIGLARALSPNAGSYETSNEDAFRLYSEGREASPEVAITDLEQAVRKDPGFGSAWETLIELRTVRGDKQEAEALLAQARQQKLEPLAVANLDLVAATLRGDQKDRLAALKRVSALNPGDTVLRRSLAETESAQGQFAESAADWQKLREILSTDPDVWNQLGYTQAWSGNYTAAVQTMEGYAKLRPADPNPLDSLGDVHYLFRKFPEAAAAYQQAATKSPDFQAGGDFYKAAWAKFRAGDQKGADAAFAEFQKIREKNGQVTLTHADWLYRTGRQKDAVAELRKALTAENVTPADKSAWLGELAVWDLLAGDRTLAAKDSEAAGQPATPSAFLIRFATMPSAPASEWEARAVRFVPNPAALSVRNLALGYALLLDGKKEAALPVWQQLADTAPATDFTVKAMFSALKGEKPRLALLPDPSSVNPFAAVHEHYK